VLFSFGFFNALPYKIQVLRKYSDKTVAMNLVEELESYGGDPSHIVMSREQSYVSCGGKY
jgi:hypothetical protein